MGLSELLGGFAGENGEKHPLMHAFPQVRNIRHEKVPRKPLRSSGIMSNLGPFFCKRAQKMGRRGTDIANNKLRAPEMGHRTKRERVLRLCRHRRSAGRQAAHRAGTANSPAAGEHGRAVRPPEGAEPGPNRKLANEDREALVRFGARRHRETARGTGGDAIGGSLAPSSPAANMPSSKPRRPAPRRTARPAHRASSPLLPARSPAVFARGDNLLSGLPITGCSEALILWCRRLVSSGERRNTDHSPNEHGCTIEARTQPNRRSKRVAL